MLIRHARLSDLDQLAHLWRELADLHANLAPEFALTSNAEQLWRKHFATVIEDAQRCVLVAEQEGVLIGFINGSLQQNPPIFVEQYVGEIASAVVTAGYRRRGIGKQLYRELARWFRERGVSVIQLDAAAANPVARAFWQKMGFGDHLLRLRTELEARSL